MSADEGDDPTSKSGEGRAEPGKSDENASSGAPWRERLRWASEKVGSLASNAEKWAEKIADSPAAESARKAGADLVEKAGELKDAPFVKRAGEAARDLAEKVGEQVGELKESEASKAALRIVKDVEESKAFDAAKQAVDKAGSKVREAAGSIAKTAEEVGASARAVLDGLDRAEKLESEDELAALMAIVFERSAEQFDREADAVSIGRYWSRGFGLGELSGRELVYVRARTGAPEIRESELRGKVARLAVSVSASAYVASLYGKGELLRHPLRRRGADVGVVIASALFFRATAVASDAIGSGFMLALSPGLGIGIPIISDLGAYDIEERLVRKFTPNPIAVERLEAALAKSPDRERLRRAATQLGAKEEPKPE